MQFRVMHSRILATVLAASMVAPAAITTPLALPIRAEAAVNDLTAQSIQLKVLCDSIIASITKPGMDQYQQLQAAYIYVMDHVDYQRDPAIPSGEWTVPYAFEALSTGKGNCYRFNVAFAYLAADLGYPAKMVTGTCKSTNGGQTPHGWCQLYIGGEWRYFDPDMQDTNRKNNFFNVSYEEYKDSRKPLIPEAEYGVGFSEAVIAAATAAEQASAAAATATAAATAAAATTPAIVPFGFYQTPQGIMWSNGDGTFKQNETFTWEGKTWVVDGTGFLHAPQAAATSAASSALPTTEFGQNVVALTSQIVNDSMTPEQKLHACYMWVCDHTTYKRTYEQPEGNWMPQYAMDVYTTGTGNCYRYAAAFAYLAKALGYDVKLRTGTISAARGGVSPHGWVIITINGQEYIVDPDMGDAKHNPDRFYMKTFEQYPVKPLNGQVDWPVVF